jgi:hypothetical protein
MAKGSSATLCDAQNGRCGIHPLLSLPGLTGQSSTPGQWLLDRPTKPGDDSHVYVNRNESFKIFSAFKSGMEITDDVDVA